MMMMMETVSCCKSTDFHLSGSSEGNKIIMSHHKLNPDKEAKKRDSEQEETELMVFYSRSDWCLKKDSCNFNCPFLRLLWFYFTDHGVDGDWGKWEEKECLQREEIEIIP